jgi:hypothetical protein
MNDNAGRIQYSIAIEQCESAFGESSPRSRIYYEPRSNSLVNRVVLHRESYQANIAHCTDNVTYHDLHRGQQHEMSSMNCYLERRRTPTDGALKDASCTHILRPCASFYTITGTGEWYSSCKGGGRNLRIHLLCCDCTDAMRQPRLCTCSPSDQEVNRERALVSRHTPKGIDG